MVEKAPSKAETAFFSRIIGTVSFKSKLKMNWESN